MRYLQGACDYWLQFIEMGEYNEVTFMSYYDLNYGEDLDIRKSTIGYVFLLGTTIVGWSRNDNLQWHYLLLKLSRLANHQRSCMDSEAIE